MELTHIEHLGIAVKSLEEAIPYYEEMLGLKCYSIEEVKDQKVKTAFFKIGQTKIELLESTDPEGTIAKFIKERRRCPSCCILHSICKDLPYRTRR